MRTLAAASYPEAMAPIASLLTDPVNDVQLEAIDNLLSFVVVNRVATKRRVALVVEVRDAKGAEAVFDMGPFELLPRPVVPEVVAGLSRAMQDETEKVRLEATYALGVLARPGLDEVGTRALIDAMADAYKSVRLAAVRVAGGLRASGAGDALINAINDKQPEIRTAAMRAVGDIRDVRAVQALTEQFDFYQRKGAYAQAALDGLARIAAPESTPVFQEQLTSKDPLMRRYAAEGLARSGRASLSLPTLESGIASEKDQHTALAFAYALQSIGRPGLDRLAGGAGQGAAGRGRDAVSDRVGTADRAPARRLPAEPGRSHPRVRGDGAGAGRRALTRWPRWNARSRTPTPTWRVPWNARSRGRGWARRGAARSLAAGGLPRLQPSAYSLWPWPWLLILRRSVPRRGGRAC